MRAPCSLKAGSSFHAGPALDGEVRIEIPQLRNGLLRLLVVAGQLRGSRGTRSAIVTVKIGRIEAACVAD
jgi:hypothetical protein